MSLNRYEKTVISMAAKQSSLSVNTDESFYCPQRRTLRRVGGVFEIVSSVKSSEEQEQE